MMTHPTTIRVVVQSKVEGAVEFWDTLYEEDATKKQTKKKNNDHIVILEWEKKKSFPLHRKRCAQSYHIQFCTNDCNTNTRVLV